MVETTTYPTKRYSMHVEGMTCNGCVRRVTESLEGITHTSAVTVSLDSGLATFSYSGSEMNDTFIKAIREGAGKNATVQTCELFSPKRRVRMHVAGMTSQKCVASVTKALENCDGTEEISVVLDSGIASCMYAGDAALLMKAVVTASGKHAELLGEGRKVLMKIDGMTCMNCVNKVKECLSSLNTTSAVDVSLDDGTTTLYYTGDDEDELAKYVTVTTNKHATILRKVGQNPEESKEGLQSEQGAEKRIVTVRVEGMTCMGCVGAVKGALEALETASDVEVSLESGIATLSYGGEEGILVSAILEGSGKKATVLQPQMDRPVTLRVEGMTCMGCVGRVTGALEALKSASDVKVDLESGFATLNFGGEDEALVKAIFDGSGKVSSILQSEGESRDVAL